MKKPGVLAVVLTAAISMTISKEKVDKRLPAATATVTDLQGELSIESVSGNVQTMGAVHEVEVSTVSGTIQFKPDGPLEKGLFKSVSGKIDVAASLEAAGRFHFETVSGPIDLRLPKRVSAEFDVSTFSGDITNDLGEKATKRDQYLPSQDLKFSLGGGGARVSVQTLSGVIHLRAE